MVTRGSKERLLIDGAGLCSPGHWPPWSRHPTSIFGRKVRAQVELTMREEQIDVRNLIENMSSGKVGGDPFQQEALASAKAGIEALVKGKVEAWAPVGEPLVQNIDVKLLSILLSELGDPDAEVFAQYECGVRLGVGVELPRTPAVFAEKQHWNVPGQADYDGADVVEGAWRDNYASAELH